MVISILGMGFVFSLLGIASDYVPAAAAGPVFALAFFWSVAELIVRDKGNWKAVHPGARVLVCLVLWLSAVSTLETAVRGAPRPHAASRRRRIPPLRRRLRRHLRPHPPAAQRRHRLEAVLGGPHPPAAQPRHRLEAVPAPPSPGVVHPAPVQTQPAAAEMGGDEKGHVFREFYTPGTAQ
ncbi:hypothetical protein MAJ_09451, partial [Metarhizium majus ARSEF 297]